MIGKISEFKEQTKQKISKVLSKNEQQNLEVQEQGDQQNINNDQEEKEELEPQKKSPKKNFTSLVTEKYQKVSNIATSQYKNMKNEVKDKLNDIKVEIKGELNKIDEKFKEMLRGYKEKLNIWIRVKIQENVLKVLESQRPKLKKALKDPLMFQWIQDLVDDIVDEIYPEIVEEIKYQLNLKMSEPYVEVSTPQHFCLFKPYFWIRAWYLYITNPYDQSFWWQIRTFSWWIFFLISAVPVFGIQAYFFVIVFFLLDKSDEFQLVNYIVSFKKMQFLTLGCMKGIIGYGLYFYCATLYYNDDLDKNQALETHDCFDRGPGVSIDYIIDTISFLVEIAFVWIAFIAIFCSKPKGKAKFRYEQLDNTPQFDTHLSSKCCCCTFSQSHGGRLKCLMIYEIFIGAISIGLYFIFYYVIFTDEQRIENESKQIIFCIQTFYGLMSFPWLIFLIPAVQLLLTKSRATAYDSKGNCVPSDRSIKIIEKNKQQDLEAQNLLFEIDLAEAVS